MNFKIFVTAGTQLPFERLLRWVDEWASSNRNVSVVAQSCDITEQYSSIETVHFMSPSEYKNAILSANLLVGHAGIGTIISAHEHEVPLIIVPREFALGEHRNDHQIATAKKFECINGVYVARTKQQLLGLLANKELSPCSSDSSVNRTNFIAELKTIFEDILK